MTEIKMLKISNAAEGAEQGELSYVACGNEKGSATLENSLGVSIWPISPSSEYLL